MIFEYIKEIAAKVPSEYPMEGLDAWDNLESVKALSAACIESGYPALGKAVVGGKAWGRRIANAYDAESLRLLEEYAAEPGWSWNKHLTEPT